MQEFRCAMIGSLFREPIFTSQRSKQLIVRVSKWPPAVQNGSPLCSGQIFRCTGIRKWPPYGGPSLDAEVFRPLERIEPVFNAFQWAFIFRLTRILLYSDFAGTDYPHQVRHHCIHTGFKFLYIVLRFKFKSCEETVVFSFTRNKQHKKVRRLLHYRYFVE